MADFADNRATTRGLGARVGVATGANTSNTVAVNVRGQVVTVQTVRGLTVALNDLVLLTKTGSTWYAVALLGPSALDPTTLTSDPAPDVRPAYRTGRFVLHPVETATYRAGVGWRDDTTDLYQGDPNGGGRMTGCAFYGTTPRALAGATITRAAVKLRRLSAGGDTTAAAPTVKLVTETTKPAGAPTLTSSVTGPSLRPEGDDTDAGLVLSNTWGQGLVDGTYGGLAVNVAADTPYLRLAGRDTWAAGMAVVLDWRRDG